MSLRLYPFRQYSDVDVINMFASDTVDATPSTNGNGSAGVFVKVSAGNLDLDPIQYTATDITNTLGKADYPFLGAVQYPAVPLRFTAATAGEPVLGLTLNQTLAADENGERLLYNPVKRAELQAVNKGVGDENPSDLERYVGDFVFNPIVDAGQTEIKLNEPAKVLEIGTGFMMIKRKVFDEYKAAYPQYSYKPDHVRTAAFDGTREIHAYFDCIIL